jgi:putative salt-induced outer membrane protein YdiY
MILKCLGLNTRSVLKSDRPDHYDLCNSLLVLIDTTNVKRNDEGKRRKRKNEGINRRKDTLIKKAYELGEFDGIDVALIICKHGRYSTYRSRDHTSWPLLIAEMVSKRLLA